MVHYFGLGSDSPVEDSEQIVARSLKKLSDDYYVLHHVTWQSRRGGRQGDGEADFIIVHPKRGVAVLEVKGGGIQVADGRWLSTDRRGKDHFIKNPYEQAIASKHALIAWLQKDIGITNVGVCHAVAFPHLDAVPHLGPMASQEITWSSHDLKDPESAVEKVFKHWKSKANLSGPETRKLLNLLAPTVTARRSLGNASSASDAEILTLTAQQVEALSGLRSNRGGLIFGGAGTGKTVLAIARARQLAAEGFRTLLVCYNELLGASLSSQFADSTVLTASTFHSLCFREAKKAGIELPSSPTQQWWEQEAAEVLIEACSINGVEFDSVVVDEGQDFAPSWLESLKCLVGSKAEAPFYAFADPRQEFWGRNWSSGSDWPFTHELTKNLRNTNPVAEKVSSVFQSNDRPSGVNGPAPKWRDLRNPKYPEADVIPVVEQLIDEGFGPANLVVLCSSGTAVKRLRTSTVGHYSFGSWNGRGIAVESIARFKGLESQAIVILLDSAEKSLEKLHGYVGMSRARTVLSVIGTGKQRSLLNWDHSAVVKSK